MFVAYINFKRTKQKDNVKKIDAPQRCVPVLLYFFVSDLITNTYHRCQTGKFNIPLFHSWAVTFINLQYNNHCWDNLTRTRFKQKVPWHQSLKLKINQYSTIHYWMTDIYRSAANTPSRYFSRQVAEELYPPHVQTANQLCGFPLEKFFVFLLSQTSSPLHDLCAVACLFPWNKTNRI